MGFANSLLSKTIPVIITSGTVTIASGTVTVSGPVAISSVSGTVSISGSVSISGTPAVTISSGSVTVSGSVSITGTTTISGTVAVSSISGTVSISGAVSVSSISGTVSISGAVSVSSVSGTVTISGSVSISGTPSVTISGTPAVSISGSITATISSGSVTITSGTITSITNNVAVYAPAQLVFSGPFSTLSGSTVPAIALAAGGRTLMIVIKTLTHTGTLTLQGASSNADYLAGLTGTPNIQGANQIIYKTFDSTVDSQVTATIADSLAGTCVIYALGEPIAPSYGYAQNETLPGGVGNVAVVGGIASFGAVVTPIAVDSSGAQMVVGRAASGNAVAGNPVLVGGSDGVNARSISTDTAGKQNVNVSNTPSVAQSGTWSVTSDVGDPSNTSMTASVNLAASMATWIGPTTGTNYISVINISVDVTVFTTADVLKIQDSNGKILFEIRITATGNRTYPVPFGRLYAGAGGASGTLEIVTGGSLSVTGVVSVSAPYSTTE